MPLMCQPRTPVVLPQLPRPSDTRSQEGCQTWLEACRDSLGSDKGLEIVKGHPTLACRGGQHLAEALLCGHLGTWGQMSSGMRSMCQAGLTGLSRVAQRVTVPVKVPYSLAADVASEHLGPHLCSVTGTFMADPAGALDPLSLTGGGRQTCAAEILSIGNLTSDCFPNTASQSSL